MAYGEIYNTTWWGVALDTARTAGTEPDFFGSQMKLLTSNQPELVTNGDFATDSGWIKGTGWSIANGKASKVAGSATELVQIGAFPSDFSSKTFKIAFNLEVTAGSVRLRAGLNNQSYLNSSGSYVYSLTPTGNDQLKFGADSSFVGSIDNVSVQVARLDLDQIEAKKCLADWIHTTALQDLNN